MTYRLHKFTAEPLHNQQVKIAVASGRSIKWTPAIYSSLSRGFTTEETKQFYIFSGTLWQE